MKKRIVSIIMALAMVLGQLAAYTPTAYAAYYPNIVTNTSNSGVAAAIATIVENVTNIVRSFADKHDYTILSNVSSVGESGSADGAIGAASSNDSAAYGTVYASATDASYADASKFTVKVGETTVETGISGANVIAWKSSTPVPTVSGTHIYGNGAALIIAADGAGTTIYVDFDRDGVIDSEDKSLKTLGIANAPADGADIADYSIYGGGTSGVSGDTQITMLSGKVWRLIGGGINSNVTGDVLIDIRGGEVRASIFGYGDGNGDVLGTRTLKLSGAPKIGAVQVGIIVKSFTNSRVYVTETLGNAANIRIYCVSESDGTIIVEAQNGAALDAARFNVIDRNMQSVAACVVGKTL